MVANQRGNTRHFSASVALTTQGEQMLGVMVRTPTELWVYWQTPSPGLTLRLQDVSGFPNDALTALRDVPITDGATDLWLQGLMPGHLYLVAIGEGQGDAFQPALSAGPVLTGGAVS